MNKKLWVPLLVVILVIIALGFIWKAKSPKNINNELTKITFPISWFNGAQYAFVYVAKENGYFKEEGLDVDIIENKGSAITSKIIASGEYPIGMISADTALISKSKGLPITVVAVADKISPSGITCHKSANVNKPTDLYGKKVGVTITSNTYQQWLAFLKLTNLDKNKIQEIPVGAAGAEFLAGQVDCFVLYPNVLTIPSATVKNIDVSSMDFYDYGLKMYGQTISANSDYLNKNPEIVSKIVRALLKGLEFERKNPDQTLDIVMKLNPDKDRNYEKLVLDGRLQLDKKLTSDTSPYDGIMTDDIWQNTKIELNDLKMLDTDVNLNDFYTDKFVK